MIGYFALANPYAQEARIMITLSNGKNVLGDHITQAWSYKMEKMELNCINDTRRGILFFTYKGSGLQSVEVKNKVEPDRQ